MFQCNKEMASKSIVSAVVGHVIVYFRNFIDRSLVYYSSNCFTFALTKTIFSLARPFNALLIVFSVQCEHSTMMGVRNSG